MRATAARRAKRVGASRGDQPACRAFPCNSVGRYYSGPPRLEVRNELCDGVSRSIQLRSRVRAPAGASISWRMSVSKPRVAVLISGEGTNLQALIDAVASGEIAGTIAVVVSNRAAARGLERARTAGI